LDIDGIGIRGPRGNYLLAIYSAVIIHSLLESPPFRSMIFPAFLRSKTWTGRGFPIAMFDYRRVAVCDLETMTHEKFDDYRIKNG